ncbi:linker for activation of T-cells family member 2 isoform X2 [Podarcis raffonei]|uniref:linker for activation of T-cells family member 2 isoform X2 n=1 Tax=Podarcis raffonei TaxID=65483 RepID=UPI0023292818|nr:linker for activation of T-cells family member 2 isoform X2 [Podarcis raffonei]
MTSMTSLLLFPWFILHIFSPWIFYKNYTNRFSIIASIKNDLRCQIYLKAASVFSCTQLFSIYSINVFQSSLNVCSSCSLILYVKSASCAYSVNFKLNFSHIFAHNEGNAVLGGKMLKTKHQRFSPYLFSYAEQQRFEAARSHSMSRHDCPKIPCDMPGRSIRSKDLALPSHLQACPEPRYQNIEKVLQMEQDPAYVKPIAADIYYNCGSFIRQSSGKWRRQEYADEGCAVWMCGGSLRYRAQRTQGLGRGDTTTSLLLYAFSQAPNRNWASFLCHVDSQIFPLSDEDTYSYQNVAGPSRSSGLVLADVDVYENSTTIQIWKHSQIAEDSDNDESDYINSHPNCRFPA